MAKRSSGARMRCGELGQCVGVALLAALGCSSPAGKARAQPVRAWCISCSSSASSRRAVLVQLPSSCRQGASRVS